MSATSCLQYIQYSPLRFARYRQIRSTSPRSPQIDIRSCLFVFRKLTLSRILYNDGPLLLGTTLEAMATDHPFLGRGCARKKRPAYLLVL